MGLVCKAIVLGVVRVVHALKSEIMDGSMNVCRSEDASTVETEIEVQC